MDNYLLSRNRAQAYFLRFDQEMLIRSWNLKYDAAYLYVDFLGRPYRICRKTGSVTRLWEEKEAGFEEVLSIFDLLCHEGEGKYLSGRYAPVNSLKGRPPTAGVDTNFYASAAACFDKDPEAFQAACLALGGVPAAMGDMGFQFPVFGDMTVILKFYHSDEDFPAGITLLWDENTLRYLFYETTYYIAGFLLNTITEKMRKRSETMYYDYDKYVTAFSDSFIRVVIDPAYYEQIEAFVKRLIAEKAKEKHHQVDNYHEEKRFMTGFLGEAALEKLLGISIIDWSIGYSGLYHRPDIPSHSVGVKTVERGKFPVVFKNNYYPQIMCIRSDKMKNLVFVCGLATPQVLNTYQDPSLILDPQLRERGTKTGFYGYQYLKPVTSLADIAQYRK